MIKVWNDNGKVLMFATAGELVEYAREHPLVGRKMTVDGCDWEFKTGCYNSISNSGHVGWNAGFLPVESSSIRETMLKPIFRNNVSPADRTVWVGDVNSKDDRRPEFMKW
jgi:hypothetical protein